MLHPSIIRHYLQKNQGIADFFSNRPNQPVEKFKHIGEKLQQEAERMGYKPINIAKIFGVKSPSVYDWYRHGRIHRKHYAKLVEIFGKPLSWWLNMPDDHAHAANESIPVYADLDPRHQVLLELFEGLPGKEQDELIRSLEEKKQHYDSVIAELLARKKTG